MPDQVPQPHPLTLQASLKRTEEKLTKNKILSNKPCNAGFCINTQFELPNPSTPVHPSKFPRDIKRLRQDFEKEFWSIRNIPETNDSSAGDLPPGIDRIEIVDEKYHQSKCNVVGIGPNKLTLSQFKQRYLYCNIPCIIQNLSIPITKEWHYCQPKEKDEDHGGIANTNVHKEIINTKWFLDNIGEATIVPVRVNQEGYEDGRAAESLTIKMTMNEWICQNRNDPKYYLKDWHMQSNFQELYEPPIVFDDVLNPFLIKNEGGDYRFVYWGCKGSTTGIHSDVLNSFSWSYNVVGRKKWTFYHPNDEVGSSEGAIVVIQYTGEMMFVPSGWRHSVENLEETISVNHNWIMAGALDCVFECLDEEIKAIEEELDAWGTISADSMDVVDLCRVREDMLRGCVGMDITTFCVLVLECCTEGLVSLLGNKISQQGGYNEAQKWYDFICIRRVLGIILKNASNEENETMSIKYRLISVLGHDKGLELMDLMHAIYKSTDSCIDMLLERR